MKRTLISALIFLSVQLCAQDQASPYLQVMQNTMEALNACETLEDYQNTANTFARIAQKNDEKWLPPYYTGFTYIIMSFQKGLTDDERDDYLERAEEYIEKAGEIAENNSEISTLMGYAKMAKLSIKPALRGPFMTSTVMSLFKKAMEQNPENPRAHLMMARMKYGTAQFFRSGTEEACQMAQKSIVLFDNEKATDRGLNPKWGYGMAKGMVKNCTTTKE